MLRSLAPRFAPPAASLRHTRIEDTMHAPRPGPALRTTPPVAGKWAGAGAGARRRALRSVAQRTSRAAQPKSSCGPVLPWRCQFLPM